jgi:DNA-binding MarR family transcriptional regulator/GNAT superfamily N-acetyltransferase
MLWNNPHPRHTTVSAAAMPAPLPTASAAASTVSAAVSPAISARAQTLRAFSRLYTRRIGVIGETVLDSPFSLAETRVFWELTYGPPRITATELARTLDLDAGYLSRLLASLRRRGFVKVESDAADGRRRYLSLSASGKRAFAPLERRSHLQMSALLLPLSDAQQRELVDAAARIGSLLGDTAAATSPAAAVRLRAQRPGDMGWVVMRHAELYAQEYGWDSRFEALVARIAADFIDRFDAQREACWIAERGEGAAAERLGCVFLVQARDEKTDRPEPDVAQLRMLIVEPAARGLGLGRRLVDECERFARERGYKRIRLWTNSVLLAARAIYKSKGYRLLARERHASFGKKNLVGEIWELDL